MPKPTSLLKENRRDQERNGRCALDKQTFARNAYIDHQYIQGRYCFETRNLTLNDIERLLFPRDVRLIVSRSIELHVIFILVLIGFFSTLFTFLFSEKILCTLQRQRFLID